VIYLCAWINEYAELRWYQNQVEEHEGEGIRVVFKLPDHVRGSRAAAAYLRSELLRAQVTWLRPLNPSLTHWLLDPTTLQIERPTLETPSWARHKAAVVPNYRHDYRIGWRQFGAAIAFELDQNYPREVEVPTFFPELSESLAEFHHQHPRSGRYAFVMMRFGETRLHNEIISGIRAACDSLGLVALRADDRTYSDDLLLNVRTYMHGCDFGIAVFERLT
jgi:hypothetical protein